MSEDKKKIIRKNLFKLSCVFPDRKLLSEGIDVYCEMLIDLPVEAILKAVKHCLRECRFFPTIAEIRDKAGIDKDSNAELSGLFYDLLDGKTSDERPEIQKALNSVGGLDSLRKLKDRDLQFIKKDFIEYAKDYKKSAVTKYLDTGPKNKLLNKCILNTKRDDNNRPVKVGGGGMIINRINILGGKRS